MTPWSKYSFNIHSVSQRNLTGPEQPASYARSDQVSELTGSLLQISAVPEPTENKNKARNSSRLSFQTEEILQTSSFLQELLQDLLVPV